MEMRREDQELLADLLPRPFQTLDHCEDVLPRLIALTALMTHHVASVFCGDSEWVIDRVSRIDVHAL